MRLEPTRLREGPVRGDGERPIADLPGQLGHELGDLGRLVAPFANDVEGRVGPQNPPHEARPAHRLFRRGAVATMDTSPPIGGSGQSPHALIETG